MKKKVAVITGGARRLGRDIAMMFAGNGFDIAFSYNSTPADVLNATISDLKSYNVNVLSVKADLSLVSDIRKMFDIIMKTYSDIDVLVNNAAIFRKVDFFDISEEIFNEFINTNLKNVLFCSLEASKIMIKNPDKPCHILNIASLGGYLNWQNHIPYSLAKAGVLKLTKLLAKRLAPDILVNDISPGTIIIKNDDNSNVDFKEVHDYPLKRFGEEKDITSLIEYLILKNKFITGQSIIADGGRILK